MHISPEIDRICAAAINAQIKRARRGDYRLKIPALKGLMRRGEGREYHFAPELFIQLSGGQRFNFPHQQFILKAGECCLMPVGMPHRETPWLKNDPNHHLVIMLSTNIISWHYKTGKPGSGIRVIGPTAVVQTPEWQRVVSYMVDLCEVYHSGWSGRENAVQGLILAALALIKRTMDESGPVKAGDSYKSNQCRMLVLQYLADPLLSVKILARQIQCSPNYLSYIFRKETGTNLIAFIQHERLTQAKALLETSSLNIEETGRAVGIPDPSYFTRIFRKSAGMSPKQYRTKALTGR